MTNPKSVNDYFIPTRQGSFLLVATDGWPDSFQTCFLCHCSKIVAIISEINFVTQGTRSVAGIFMGREKR